MFNIRTNKKTKSATFVITNQKNKLFIDNVNIEDKIYSEEGMVLEENNTYKILPYDGQHDDKFRSLNKPIPTKNKFVSAKVNGTEYTGTMILVSGDKVSVFEPLNSVKSFSKFE